MSSYLDGTALYIVIRTEQHQLWARLVSNREDRVIRVDTSYSPANFHNYSYRDTPIGTYITVRNGFINSFREGNG